MPEGVVTMLSTVEFVDEGSGTRRPVQMVYPADADISSGKISILTPIGAGLIGLSEGQSILWPDRDGHERCLQIVRVTREQEADRILNQLRRIKTASETISTSGPLKNTEKRQER